MRACFFECVIPVLPRAVFVVRLHWRSRQDSEPLARNCGTVD